MLKACLLGTGGTMPLHYRYLTALLLRYNGSSLLVDCGEGTQAAIAGSGESIFPIDFILITHYHADHIMGLPGLLLSMGMYGRREKVTIACPGANGHIMETLLSLAPNLPFDVEIIWLQGADGVFKWKDITVNAYKLCHSIECYGYSFTLRRKGRFQLERAIEAGIDKKYWSRLQSGMTIIDGERTLTPDMVLGEERKGLKLSYCTDTRPCEQILNLANGSDLFICEGMYGGDDKLEDAIEKKHMTFTEAARMAADANVKELWLTHYSPSISRPDEFIDAAKAVFPNTSAPQDGRMTDLCFENE